jgi:hypothetical protein
MTEKNVKKPATKKTPMSSSKITKLGNKALESVIDIVRDMTDLSTRTVNLSQEILLGFKDYADIYLVNTTEMTIGQIVRQFREDIYQKCLFLLPSQKTIAYSDSKMAKLEGSKEPKDQADAKHYKKCMREHPDLDGGNHGLPSKRLQDVFSLIAQLPKLMEFAKDNNTNVLHSDYSSLDNIPDRLSQIKTDKVAMNKVINEKKAEEKRKEELDSKLGSSLIACANSFDNFIRLIDDCRKVIKDVKVQNNVAKIGNAVSRKVDSDLFKLNVILQDQLSLPSNKEKLNSSFSVIKETSDGIMIKMDQAIKKAESKIDKIAIEVKTQSTSTNK